MLKKMRRRVKTLITKRFKKPKSKPPPNPSSPPQEQDIASPQTMPHSHQNNKDSPFIFPQSQSTVLPDPSSSFFSQTLTKTPLPTNSFFQNLTLKNGDQPEYFHPYLIKSTSHSLSLSYPSRFSTSAFLYQVFNADITITSSTQNPEERHVISSFDDLSITLDYPSANLRFFLARGSPFLTCSVSNRASVSISTIHAVLSLTSNQPRTKYTIKLNNNQTWLLYTSSPIDLTNPTLSQMTSSPFSGVMRVALLPESSPEMEEVLDQFSSCYPVSGGACFARPFALEYKWEKKGWGDLLMLAHPLHLKLIDRNECDVTVLEGFKYKSIDGDLVGVVGDSWVLKPDPVSITWHSSKGVELACCDEVLSALDKDVEGLVGAPIATSSSYFYGKLIARAARLALIAEEVGYLDVIPKIKKYLSDAIEPWLDGTFRENGFLYDTKWGGVMTKQGSLDSGADFGFGIYNDHHYHLGYFLYAIAVLAKIDSSWGRKYRPQAYALAADFMNLSRRANSSYPRLRCFDLYKLHSWAGGLTEFADGRNQESTSEAVNAYYSAALLGLAYGDSHLGAIGSMLTALEINAAQMWWQVKEGDTIYDEDFTRENRVVGVLWANKRDSGLWFAPSAWKECRLGIQLLPLSPISEVLFSDVGFVRQLVEWAEPALSREGVGEGWKCFVYSLQGMYDKEGALAKIRNLKGYDDGNSLTNLLWWIHSRGGKDMLKKGLLAIDDVKKAAEAHVYVYEAMDNETSGTYLCFGKVVRTRSEAIKLENTLKVQGLLSGLARSTEVLDEGADAEINSMLSNAKLVRLIQASKRLSCKLEV